MLLWTLLIVVIVGGAGFLYLLTIPAPLERWLQARMLLALHEHYQADVQLQNLHVTLIPEFNATADNFVLPNRRGGDVPPLITVKHFTVRANFIELLRKPIRLAQVNLEGMEIKVAPKQPAQASSEAAQEPKHHTRFADFVIDRVQADGTMLYILRKDPTKEPMLFELRQLALRSAGVGQPMTFTAELTIPRRRASLIRRDTSGRGISTSRRQRRSTGTTISNMPICPCSTASRASCRRWATTRVR